MHVVPMKNGRIRRVACCLAAGLLTSTSLLVAQPAGAAPGALDATFGGDGMVTTEFAGDTDSVEAIALQSGKVVAGGYTEASSDDFALTRYGFGGALDPGFGAGGRVVTDFEGGDDQITDLVVQTDGKLVAAGYAHVDGTYDFALARYRTDGSLDTTFGDSGTVTADFGGHTDACLAVALQSDGKIVVAGYAGGSYDFAVARYETDGTLDSTFGTGGKTTVDLGSIEAPYGLAIQSDGRMVLGGMTADFPDTDVALVRLDLAGNLDTTFGSGGIATHDLGDEEEVEAMELTDSEQILVAGSMPDGTDHDFLLARFSADGDLDPTFGTGGKTLTDLGDSDDAHAMTVASSGRITLAGSTWNGSDGDFGLARYLPSGALDTGFGDAGIVTTDFGGGGDSAHAVKLLPRGRLIVGGYSNDGTGLDFAMARYR